MDVFDDTHLLHLVSDTQRLSFSREFKPTLTLGFNLGLGSGLPWGHFQDIKFFILTSVKDFSMELRRYPSFAFALRFSTLIFFPGVNSNNNPELSLGLWLGLAWGHFQDIKFLIYTSFKDFSLDIFDDTHL